MSLDLLRAGLILAAALLIAALPAQAQSERSAGELKDAVMWNKEPMGTRPASHLKQPLRPLPQEFRVREPAPSAALYYILHGLGHRDPKLPCAREQPVPGAAPHRNAASFPLLQVWLGNWCGLNA
jgi:hypothetical protein